MTQDNLVTDESRETLETDTSSIAPPVECPSLGSAPSMEYSKSVDSEEVLRNSIPRTSTTTDWPLNEIKEPHKNDVLYGRGGG